MKLDLNSLSELQKKAVSAYKSSNEIIQGKSFTYDLNLHLLKGNSIPSEYSEYVIGLDELSRNYPLEECLTLHRACDLSTVQSYLDDQKNINVYNAFMSASESDTNLSEHYAGLNCTPCHLVINCKPKCNIIPLEYTDNQSHEREILIPRGGLFRLDSVVDITDEKIIKKIMGSYHGSKIELLKRFHLELLA